MHRIPGKQPLWSYAPRLSSHFEECRIDGCPRADAGLAAKHSLRVPQHEDRQWNRRESGKEMQGQESEVVVAVRGNVLQAGPG